MKRIALAGATGLVGNCVLNSLKKLPDHHTISFTRKEITPSDHSVQHENRVINWDEFDFSAIEADLFICCLGTTIQAAGSQENFRKVDYTYVKKFAEMAQSSQAKKFIVISANGAHPQSKIFYNRTKGEIEETLKEMNFPSLAILRPSLLIGERTEKRKAEAFAQKIMPYFDLLLQGPLKKYQSISAEAVAKTIIELLDFSWSGELILESDQIKKGLDS